MKNKLKPILIGLTGALAVFILGLFIINAAPNKAINLEEQVSEGASEIEVQEKRRVDLVYNLVDIVKEYSTYESQTLKDIIDARTSNGGDIGSVTTAIAATAEAYPELKANENYKELMNELSVTENLIAQIRSNYNSQVKEYKRYVRKFPSKQLLSLAGYEVVEYQYLEFNAPSDAPQNLFDRN